MSKKHSRLYNRIQDCQKLDFETKAEALRYIKLLEGNSRRAKEERKKVHCNIENKDLEYDLGGAFIWRNTPQGYDWWNHKVNRFLY